MQNVESGVKDRIKLFLTNNQIFKKSKTLIVVVLVIVVFLIFASSFKTVNQSKSVEVETSLSAVEYCEATENRLCNVLGQIKNIGNVNVFIMVDSSPTIKYLEETNTETTKKDNSEVVSIETQIVMQKNGTLTTPVVVVELMPKITGVLVVASGAKDIKLKTMLINTVSAILNINASNVEVLEGKK